MLRADVRAAFLPSARDLNCCHLQIGEGQSGVWSCSASLPQLGVLGGFFLASLAWYLPSYILTPLATPFFDHSPSSHKLSWTSLTLSFMSFIISPPQHVVLIFLGLSILSLNSHSSCLISLSIPGSPSSIPLVELLLCVNNSVLAWGVGLQQLLSNVIHSSNSCCQGIHFGFQGLKPKGVEE